MDGCGHCDKFNSTWDELVSFYKDNNKVKLFKYDINEGKGKELATTYKINSAPTIKIINNGVFLLVSHQISIFFRSIFI